MKPPKGILAACKPRQEVLKGELDDAIFAADFGQLITGSAPKVHGDGETFFRNTEPTPDLKSVRAAAIGHWPGLPAGRFCGLPCVTPE